MYYYISWPWEPWKTFIFKTQNGVKWISNILQANFRFFLFSPIGVIYHRYLSASFHCIGVGVITISFCDKWHPVWWQRAPDELTASRIMTVIRSTCRRERHLLSKEMSICSYKLHATWKRRLEHRLKETWELAERALYCIPSEKKTIKKEKCTLPSFHEKHCTSQPPLIKHYPKDISE